MARLHPEIASELEMGRLGALAGWRGRIVRLTLARPRLADWLCAPLLLVLDVAAHMNVTGRSLENLHAVARGHLYAMGMVDAGYRPGRES
jgi:hypothetical protein